MHTTSLLPEREVESSRWLCPCFRRKHSAPMLLVTHTEAPVVVKPRLRKQTSFQPADCRAGPLLCEMANIKAAQSGSMEEGCFNMHSNVTGRYAWCCSERCFDKYLEKHTAKLSKYKYWTEVDIASIDPTFACRFGSRCGVKNSKETLCNAHFEDLYEKLTAAKKELQVISLNTLYCNHRVLSPRTCTR